MSDDIGRESGRDHYWSSSKRTRMPACDFLAIVGHDAPVVEIIKFIKYGNFSISPLARQNNNYDLDPPNNDPLYTPLHASLDAVFCKIFQKNDLDAPITATDYSPDVTRIIQQREAISYYTAFDLAHVYRNWSQKYNSQKPKL